MNLFFAAGFKDNKPSYMVKIYPDNRGDIIFFEKQGEQISGTIHTNVKEAVYKGMILDKEDCTGIDHRVYERRLMDFTLYLKQYQYNESRQPDKL